MTQTDDTEHPTAHTPEPWTQEYLPYISSTRADIPCYRIHAYDAPEDYICATNEHLDDEVQYANARRICATVNACKGISTEALDRKTITEMRHVLGQLLTGAGELDAAIDGATDEFDAERATLAPVFRAAQDILEGGMALDLHELLASRRQIALIWAIEDVQEIRADLTEEQAWEVLQHVKRRHDASLGVNWLTLELAAEDLFGDAPEAAGEQGLP